jgi:hypothetical protein
MKTALPSTSLFFTACALVLACPSGSDAAVIAQYHFDEVSGFTAFDSAGSFNGTLTPTGATFVGGGISGNAISLNQGLGGLVNMGTSFPAFTSGDFSIVLWVNTTTTAADTIPLAKHKAGTQNGYLFAINTTGGGGTLNKSTFVVGSEFVAQAPTSTTSVNDGLWHQIVGVFNAGGTHSIYVDGSPLEAFSNSPGVPDLGAPFLIGGVREIAGTNNPEARYTGLIDEVQVYDQALTDAQITALFQNPSQAVPEPSAAALLLGGGLALLRRNRRQTK